MRFPVCRSLWSQEEVLSRTESGCNGDCTALASTVPSCGRRKWDTRVRGLGSLGWRPAILKDKAELDSS